MPEHLKTLQTWFQRVWHEQDPCAVDEMFAPKGEAFGLGNQTKLGPEDFKQFHSAICTLISDIEITIDKYIEEGPWLSALCTVHAKAIASGSPVSMTGSVFGRIENGVIQEAYNHWDFIGLWSQLGFLPADTFEQGLLGQRIA